MNITATTTDADILANAEAARERIVRLCAERADAVTIAQAANDLARAEGAAAARIGYRNALLDGARHRSMAATHPEVRAAAQAYVTSLVLNGADDNWSGRDNDARRARFDGLREAAAEFIRGY